LKKILSVLPSFLFLCYCTLPLFSIIGKVCGYNFVLRSYPVFSITLAIISLIASIFLFISKLTLNKINIVFSALLLPMSALNAICYLSHSHTKLTAIFALIGCACSIAVFSKFAGPIALKIISGVLSGLLLLLLLLQLLFISILVDFSSNTVEKSISSPQNTYTAEVIDDDQGALGGNTLVNVKYNSKTIDLFIGKFLKPPVRVYTGKWGEFTNMQIRWGNEHLLVIDGKEYYIND